MPTTYKRESQRRKASKADERYFREEKADQRRDYNRKLRNISDAYRKQGQFKKFIMIGSTKPKECQKYH